MVNDRGLRQLRWDMWYVLLSEGHVLFYLHLSSRWCLLRCCLSLGPYLNALILLLLVLCLSCNVRLLFFNRLLRFCWLSSDDSKPFLVPSYILIERLDVLDQLLLFILLKDSLCELFHELLLIFKGRIYLLLLHILAQLRLVGYF